MSGPKFGTSGLRGLVTELVGAPAYDHTAAFLRALGGAGETPLLIGRDLRGSSPALAATAAAAARDAGRPALDCGALPTPALALEAMRLGAPAVMVTGSHIPDDRNGLKFYTGAGEITKHDEAAILDAFAPSGLDPGPAPAQAHPEALDRFRARCLALLPPGALAGLRVGVYQQSTVARDLLVEVLAGLGAAAVPFGRAEAFIPIDTEAHRPEDLAALAEAARDGRFDAIVTADGDADRPLVADAAGRPIPGDVLGAAAARHLGVAAVAVPVTAGSALERAGGFARVLRTRVGSPFVVAGMERLLAEGFAPVAGFEANGGFLLGSSLGAGGCEIAPLPTRDSFLPILAGLAAARAAGAGLAGFVAGLGFRPTASDRLKDVPPERSAAFLATLHDPGRRAAFLQPLGRERACDEVDGLRVVLDAGVIHYRASGNAPELRCYAEADTMEGARRIVAWGLEAAGQETMR